MEVGKSSLFELLYYMIYVLATGGKKKDGPLEDMVNDLSRQIAGLNFEGYWFKELYNLKYQLRTVSNLILREN